jgi:periplasmic protein TonB
MSKAITKQRPASTPAAAANAPAARKQKISSFLVTSDDGLWPQIGAHLTQKLSHRQIDSVDELLTATQPGESAVVLWDARGAAEAAAVLSRLQTHSPRFAIVALDVAERASAWSPEVEHGQIIDVLTVPIVPDRAASVLAGAHEEASARMALLGEPPASQLSVGADADPASQVPAPGSAWSAGSSKRPRARVPLIAGAALAGLAIAALAAYYFMAHDTGGASFTAPSSARPAAKPAAASAAAPAAAASATEEKVDGLIAQAQRAMNDRHFIEPAEGSALALYRGALTLDPTRGEAQQGLKRLAEVLVARVQTALDEKQYDAALQALETVRSIDAGDLRLPALDERIAKMRDELGPAEIQAAINAQNFDRAAQLIDQAAHGKTLSEQKLAQLREDLRRHRGDSEVDRLMALIDARLQQDQLIEPANDSAEYYLAQARKAGAGAAQVQTELRELVRRLTAAAHTAIDQRRFGDADRIAAEMHAVGAPLSSVAALQHDIGVARAQQAPEPSNQSRYADLVKSRLAQGSVTGPENDSALYYLGELRASDPQNGELPQLIKSVQSRIVSQARDALDAGQPGQAQTLLRLASTLGPSAEIDALSDRSRQATAASSSGPKEVPEAALKRARALEVEYPPDALKKKIEGTVELGYVVSPKGAISDIRVIDSSPTGIFEKAATSAVERLRYRPYVDAGKAVAVSTKVLVIFRLAK